jgi:vancomycin resistance protein YoaR
MAKEKETDEERITLQRDEILHYNLLPNDFVFINQASINELMRSLEKQVAVPAIDATYDENFNIIAGKKGKALDRSEFKSRFMETYYDSTQTQFEVPLKEVEPRVDRVLLQDMSMNKLGEYTTHYNASNKERSKNVRLSTDAINGTVIFPGETFSFNETVGERTEERGYEKAPVIVKGEFAEDIGGGICQVSSTLFNAVDQDGIQIVERYTHSRSVPYVPPGKDATVSWWGPDFSFKNLYNEPVVIKARAANGNLVIELLSSETVEYFNGNKKQQFQEE